MQPRPWSLVRTISVCSVLALAISVCSFTLASNAAATSPGPTVEVSYRASEEIAPPAAGLPVARSATQPKRSRRRTLPSTSDAIITTAARSSPVQIPSPAKPAPAPAGNLPQDQYRSGFACTGSMRPTIDCGDEGIFVRPPFQRPPEVGDIISFSSNTSCRYYKNQNISKAHRIISIRSEDEVDYYTTKGDSTEKADPCETTLEQVDGMLVEVRKGVRPLDIIDTTSYELSKEWVNLLKMEYEENKAEFDLLKTGYDDRGEEYQRMVSSYKDGHAEYETVLDLYQQLEAERVALNLRKDHLNSLGNEINSAIVEVDRLYGELFIH